MASRRVRFQLSYKEGCGSELEQAIKIAGIDTSDLAQLTRMLAMGVLAWSQGWVLGIGRDGPELLARGGGGQGTTHDRTSAPSYKESSSEGCGSTSEAPPPLAGAARPAASEHSSPVAAQSKAARIKQSEVGVAGNSSSKQSQPGAIEKTGTPHEGAHPPRNQGDQPAATQESGAADPVQGGKGTRSSGSPDNRPKTGKGDRAATASPAQPDQNESKGRGEQPYGEISSAPVKVVLPVDAVDDADSSVGPDPRSDDEDIDPATLDMKKLMADFEF